MKIGDKYLACPIGVDINFSDKPEFTCTLDEEMTGGQSLYVTRDSSSIIKPENSKDILWVWFWPKLNISNAENNLDNKFGVSLISKDVELFGE